MIIGASGHGKVVADIAAHCGYKNIAFLDDDTSLKTCLTYLVVGVTADAPKYIDADFFIAIGNPKTREKVQRRLDSMKIVSLVHPDAVIAPDVVIGRGTAVMAGVVINPGTTIGDGCIINTGATVDHDNRIEDFVHVSVGGHLAGTVSVGKSTWIGAGAVVSNNVNICGGCTIGAGAVVVKDISEPGTYIGVPAKVMKCKSRKERMETNKVAEQHIFKGENCFDIAENGTGGGYGQHCLSQIKRKRSLELIFCMNSVSVWPERRLHRYA